jgi:hypothetical protein
MNKKWLIIEPLEFEPLNVQSPIFLWMIKIESVSKCGKFFISTFLHPFLYKKNFTSILYSIFYIHVLIQSFFFSFFNFVMYLKWWFEDLTKFGFKWIMKLSLSIHLLQVYLQSWRSLVIAFCIITFYVKSTYKGPIVFFNFLSNLLAIILFNFCLLHQNHLQRSKV